MSFEEIIGGAHRDTTKALLEQARAIPDEVGNQVIFDWVNTGTGRTDEQFIAVRLPKGWVVVPASDGEAFAEDLEEVVTHMAAACDCHSPSGFRMAPTEKEPRFEEKEDMTFEEAFQSLIRRILWGKN